MDSAQIQNVNAVFNTELAVLMDEASVCPLINNQGTCTYDSKSLGSHDEYLALVLKLVDLQ